MQTLALNIIMSGKRVLVVGGGAVAHRKVKSLLSAGAAIHLVAPDICQELAVLVESGAITARKGCYQPDDLLLAFMAIAATDNRTVNQSVARDAEKRAILVNVTDCPQAGNCSFPAMLRRGSLEIAVSTGGGNPALAAQIRDFLSEIIGDEYAGITDELAAAREKLLTESNSSTYNKQVLRSLAKQLINGIVERKDLP